MYFAEIFTINAMAQSTLTGEIIDYTHTGLDDIKKLKRFEFCMITVLLMTLQEL